MDLDTKIPERLHSIAREGCLPGAAHQTKFILSSEVRAGIRHRLASGGARAYRSDLPRAAQAVTGWEIQTHPRHKGMGPPLSWTRSAMHYPHRISRIKRKRSIGFRARMKTPNGRKMINRKRRVGRSLNVSDK